ncbi:L-threonine ammonia-lyase [Limimonas halophila]|uniref:L-threonine ammonia-lyase n=1 Tax=Limimonas halophila TaxID=1082479 RepID=A0A1G7P2L2_9PROT|nr:threonine/serine dehydratase [Limimonas halophila]SDF80503.1 L-threonine ammonia-lyase [Limimonas halophila]
MSAAPHARLPSYTDVAFAAARLHGAAVRTPLLTNPALNAEVGAKVLIKPETLQRTGSFKFRGAYNRLTELGVTGARGGVVAYSSGNHAQGVAHAAQLLGIPAVVVMPADAPETKVERTRAYGAEIRQYERFFECRERIAEEIAAERGATVVKPYDDPAIIAGQGTVGLEMIQQARAAGERLDTVLVCAGGGGLSAGAALACSALSPATAVYTVEPEGHDDHARSLAAGHRVANADAPPSICDALLAPTPGALTFAVNESRLAGGLAVSDTEVRSAVRTAFASLKLVVEPSGAVALAAALTGKLGQPAGTIGVVLSGGNVDAGAYADTIAGA